MKEFMLSKGVGWDLVVQIGFVWGIINGNGWESNPPRLATRPDTGVEDREAHQDLAIPTVKDNHG